MPKPKKINSSKDKNIDDMGDTLVSTLFKEKEDADFWSTAAYRVVRSQCKLFWHENVSETSLASQIADTAVGKATGGDGAKYVAITFFSQLSGEAITCPHLRLGALNDDMLKKIQKAAVKGRSGLPPDQMDNVDKLNSCDLYIVTDGGIAGARHPSLRLT